MDLSCVILSFNSSRSVRKCLESLVDAITANQIQAEILIVDNGSTDSSLEIISEISAKLTSAPNQTGAPNQPEIKLHRLEKNYGTTASRNIALRQSTGKKILILDSDAYVSPEALRGLIDYLDQHPKVGLVAPKLIFPDGRPQLSTDQFPTVSRKIERVVRLRQIEKTQVQVESTDVDYAISACWLLTREAFDAVGHSTKRSSMPPKMSTIACEFGKPDFVSSTNRNSSSYTMPKNARENFSRIDSLGSISKAWDTTSSNIDTCGVRTPCANECDPAFASNPESYRPSRLTARFA